MIILHKKVDMKDIKHYRPISWLSNMYKLFTWILQKWMEMVLDESQPREQAGFRKATWQLIINHHQTINQLIEKYYIFNRPLCLGYIDYENGFDSIEHKEIFKALRTIGINETSITIQPFTILEDIYTEAAASVHMNNPVSEEIPISIGVRQGDLISPKLFTATFRSLKMSSDAWCNG